MDGETKKSQKAGLGAIRPDDYTEETFKKMAKDRNISQTEMFEQIFWSYIRENRNENRNEALNCDSEINLIAKDLDNILRIFKGITEKAQDKIISITSNAEQTQKNLETDLDTRTKKIKALEERNTELERANEAFTEIKHGLQESIIKLNNEHTKKDEEIKELKETNREMEKSIRDMEKQAEINEKATAALKKENSTMEEEKAAKATRIHNLETTNNSLQATIENMETMKKAEIAAIEAKNQAIIAELQSKLQAVTESKEAAVKEAIRNLKTEMESDKKLAIAEIKLELADTKEKLAETISSKKKQQKSSSIPEGAKT